MAPSCHAVAHGLWIAAADETRWEHTVHGELAGETARIPAPQPSDRGCVRDGIRHASGYGRALMFRRAPAPRAPLCRTAEWRRATAAPVQFDIASRSFCTTV
jgi:hypothetical protein